MALDILKRLKVAILVTDGFEKVELTRPRDALNDAGAVTFIVSPKSSSVRSWNFTNWDEEMPVDVTLDEANLRISTRCTCRAASSTQMRSESSRRRSHSQRHSLTPASRWLRSAMAPGWWLKPAPRTGGARRRGHR